MSVYELHNMASVGKKYCANADTALVANIPSLPLSLNLHDPNTDEDKSANRDTEEDSPYAEVCSAVSNVDDRSMPVGTFRAWTLGLMWTILLPGLNQFFYFRYPYVSISSLVSQLLSFPLGLLWARVVPDVTIFGVAINPGPFTIKEHVLVTIMGTVGYQSAYATDIVAVQRFYYNQVFSFAFQWMLLMSTQLIGFSMGGAMRRFLIEPPSMIWPANLVTCALFNTLHSAYNGFDAHGGISRQRFFAYTFVGGCCWYFVPGYLFQALSYFSWVCWIVPNNIIINQLFGYQSGLGMSLITFDWAQINFVGNNPLATPWWVEVNVLAGFVIFYWILTPILYYTNTWYAKYLPISSHTSFDNTGATYNVTSVLTSVKTFNITAYEEYSPLFLSTTFAVSYGLSFASVMATIMHAILFFRQQIWSQCRPSTGERPDIHARLMSKYRQVPEWWYLVIFVIMFILGIVTVKGWETELPVWAFVVALLIGFTFIVPIGMIQAITSQQITLDVMAELTVGYAIPGRPLAMMMFKTWGFITITQALQFCSDLKVGHYMKIPPRTLFWAQVSSTIISATVQLAVQTWMFSNIPDICDPLQKNSFTCVNMHTFGTGTIIWGVIGPARIFSPGQTYNGLLWFFLVGALCPVVSWILLMKWPNSFIRYVSFPVFFAGTHFMPPASALNYVPWAIVGFIFQYVIRRRYFPWWTKYNYVLAAALDCGVAVSIVLIFFFLQYPKNGTIGSTNIAQWWGNTVFLNTADAQGASYLPLPESGTFGPKKW
ncbi:OPT oligopeptide transporter [Leucogyrophana mollusca]|uniref:OPT oligopeptide transporter n=1 Tax=Leucogyrophana mollusca TaxID=85980 RepID=A0ACB8BMH3_9AGAM|nr:OPT oligopeptide transporter [Leucogyrophana mollusca]